MHDYPVQAYLSNELIAALILGIVFSAPVAPFIERVSHSFFTWLRNRNIRTTWAKQLLETAILGVYLAIFVFCSMLLASGTHNPFIYFRF